MFSTSSTDLSTYFGARQSTLAHHQRRYPGILIATLQLLPHLAWAGITQASQPDDHEIDNDLGLIPSLTLFTQAATQMV
ncbi:hypothetical protein HYQ45_001639 [Verticillium longisporum]|uniref:Uncharacterized protein n=2 Tax=Verticillium TaxID=1036719 RepID=A0A8I3AWL7_VERLO|nr:hypothetical protein HYQ45_001639 [Verticillium longisporum]RXG46596.1 hypothetical protein VDGE_30127 [Verticillium dahliae]